MAIRWESGCVDCGLPCIGNACRYYRVKILECDDCGEEVDTLYQYDSDELCADCVLKRLEVVE